MKKTVAFYALAIVAAALALDWLEYQYLTRLFSIEIYIALIALGFTGLGIWAGSRLRQKAHPAPFERNDAALQSLGVTGREYEVLELIAAGESNKEIARSLDVSPNTVKTHVANLYEKLEVERRTQAIRRARSLDLIK